MPAQAEIDNFSKFNKNKISSMVIWDDKIYVLWKTSISNARLPPCCSPLLPYTETKQAQVLGPIGRLHIAHSQVSRIRGPHTLVVVVKASAPYYSLGLSGFLLLPLCLKPARLKGFTPVSYIFVLYN